jgi:hypothetical protein
MNKTFIAIKQGAAALSKRWFDSVNAGRPNGDPAKLAKLRDFIKKGKPKGMTYKQIGLDPKKKKLYRAAVTQLPHTEEPRAPKELGTAPSRARQENKKPKERVKKRPGAAFVKAR